MKPLTQREADRCEQAKERVCKCRCQGSKHGAARVPAGGDFSSLPLDDPHHRPAITRNQALRMLSSARRHVIGSGSLFGDYPGYQAWIDALDALYEAYKKVKAT
jgi:hypothetical protein